MLPLKLNKKGFTIGELVVVIAIVFMVVLLAQPFVVWIHNRADQGKCSNNLRELGKALYVYAKEHQGKFPEDIKILYEKQYISDIMLTDCPATKRKGTTEELEYTYTPGLSVYDTSTLSLLEDSEGNHPDGERNVLRVSGEVLRVRE